MYLNQEHISHVIICFRTSPNREHTEVSRAFKQNLFLPPSMLNPFNITISDTSPIIQYLPSQDGPIDSSWNASFSGSQDSTWVPQALGVGVRSFLSGGKPFLSYSTSSRVHTGQDFQAPQYTWIGLVPPSICTAKPLLEHIQFNSTALRQTERARQGCFFPSLAWDTDHTR